MSELAKKILEFIAYRKDDCGRFSNFEILICRIDGDVYADEGIPYLLSKHLIDIPDPNALTYRITSAGPIRPSEPRMNPKRIVQLIPAAGWRVHINSGFEDVAAFGLTRDGRVVPLVVAEDGKSIVESSDRDFTLIGPVSFEILDRAAALRNGEYRRLR